MTSTNDGKDVKSIPKSSQKEKTYFIEVYKSLESRLSGEYSSEERVQFVNEAWKQIHSLCSHSADDTHPHLLAWLQRHTTNTVLQTEWPKCQDQHAILLEAIDAFLQDCATAISKHNGVAPSWETQLKQWAVGFKKYLPNPWGHPVLQALLAGQIPSDEEILEWLKQEQGLVFATRLRQMVASKSCVDLALNLITPIRQRARVKKVEQTGGQGESSVSPSSNRETTEFARVLKEDAGFTPDVWNFLIDIEFVLLHKVNNRPACIALAKQVPFHEACPLVKRLYCRLASSPKEKKLWKNAKDVAVLIAQVVIARCMVAPSCRRDVIDALYGCARSMAHLSAPAELSAASEGLAALAVTSRHLHTMAAAVDMQLKGERTPFVCQLYVRAITAGMNELEKLKLATGKESDARATVQTLSSCFTSLGSLLSASKRLSAECILTAFSVHPSPIMYEKVKSAPHLETIKDAHETSPEKISEFGSWATDSRTQTNLVKTSETLNLKQTHKQANVLSTAIFSEGEALGLEPELCNDLAVLLSGPRVKTLTWDMDRDALLENCKTYMDRTHGGTKALTTELKYLNLDPSSFQHLPEEEDHEDDIYYGIEKGYEHLVESQEAEPEYHPQLWEEPFFESPSLSSEDSIIVVRRRKKKKKRVPIDPLKLDNEPDTNKNTELSKCIEGFEQQSVHKTPCQTGYQDQSESKVEKKKQKKPRVSEEEKKLRQDKKEADRRIKKELRELNKKSKLDAQQAKSRNKQSINCGLSNLIGMKVTTNTKEDELINKTNALKLQSIGNDGLLNSAQDNSSVVFDGFFAMDEIKFPDTKILYADTMRNLIAFNKDQPPPLAPIAPASRSKNLNLIKEDVKRNVKKLIEFRRKKIEEQRKLDSLKCYETMYPENHSPKVAAIPDIPSAGIQGGQTHEYSHVPNSQFETDGQHLNNFSQKPPERCATEFSSSEKDFEDFVSLESYEVINMLAPQPLPQPVKAKSGNSSTFDSIITRQLDEPKRETSINHSKLARQDWSQQIVSRKINKNLPCNGQISNDILRKPQEADKPNSVMYDPTQKHFQEFLKELQQSINAGTLYKQKAETTSKKIIKQQKISDNAPNTFARLSYLHKSKQMENKLRTEEEKRIKEASNRATADLDKMLHLQSTGEIMISRVSKFQLPAPKKSKDSLSLRNVKSAKSKIAQHHPNLVTSLLSPTKPQKMNANISSTNNLYPNNQTKSESTSTSLSEKDQSDLLMLLRQQSKLNSGYSLNTVDPDDALLTSGNTMISGATIKSTVNMIQPLASNTVQLPSNSGPYKEIMTNKGIELIQQTNKYTKPIIIRNEIKPSTTQANNVVKQVSPAQTFLQFKVLHEDEQEMFEINDMNLKESCNFLDSKPQNELIEQMPTLESLPEVDDFLAYQNTFHCDQIMQELKTTFEQQQSTSTMEQANLFTPSNIEVGSQPDYKQLIMPARSVQEIVLETIKIPLKPPALVRTSVDVKKKCVPNNIASSSNKPPNVEPPKTDWKSVCNDLLKHKTPSRGPKALDIALKKDSFEKHLPQSIKKGSESKKVTIKNGSTVTRKAVSTTVTQGPPPPVKETKPLNSVFGKLKANDDSSSQKFVKMKPKEDDPFISGIRNSDYDLLDELMDDDLRQEIGELSDDDTYYPLDVYTLKEKDNLKNINLKPPINIIENPVPSLVRLESTPKIEVAPNKIIKCKNPKSVILKVPKKLSSISTADDKPRVISNELIVSSKKVEKKNNIKKSKPVQSPASTKSKPQIENKTTNKNVKCNKNKTRNNKPKPNTVTSHNMKKLSNNVITIKPGKLVVEPLQQPQNKRNVTILPSSGVLENLPKIKNQRSEDSTMMHTFTPSSYIAGSSSTSSTTNRTSDSVFVDNIASGKSPVRKPTYLNQLEQKAGVPKNLQLGEEMTNEHSNNLPATSYNIQNKTLKADSKNRNQRSVSITKTETHILNNVTIKKSPVEDINQLNETKVLSELQGKLQEQVLTENKNNVVTNERIEKDNKLHQSLKSEHLLKKRTLLLNRQIIHTSSRGPIALKYMPIKPLDPLVANQTTKYTPDQQSDPLIISSTDKGNTTTILADLPLCNLQKAVNSTLMCEPEFMDTVTIKRCNEIEVESNCTNDEIIPEIKNNDAEENKINKNYEEQSKSKGSVEIVNAIKIDGNLTSSDPNQIQELTFTNQEVGNTEISLSLPCSTLNLDLTKETKKEDDFDKIEHDSIFKNSQDISNAVNSCSENSNTNGNNDEIDLYNHRLEHQKIQNVLNNTTSSVNNTDAPEFDNNADKLKTNSFLDEYRDQIQFEELPRKPTDDPSKRFIRIKLPNGSIFRATISGKLNVNVDSIFTDPQMKSILLNNTLKNKKCTLNLRQVAISNNTEEKTLINHILYKKSMSSDPETINLISDDEDDEDSTHTFDTEFGKFIVSSIEKHVVVKHQKRFSQKCIVKLQRNNITEKIIAEEACLQLKSNSITAYSDTCQMKAEETASQKTGNITNIIEINDGTDDSLEIIKTTEFAERRDNLRPKLSVDLDVMRNSILKGLLLPESFESTPNPKYIIDEQPDPFKNLKTDDILQNDSNENDNSNIVINNSINEKQKIWMSSCFVKISRCDDFPSVVENSNKLSGESSDNTTSDEEVSQELSLPLQRSGSFSILNDFVEGTLQLTETALNQPIAINNHMPSTNHNCYSDWFLTKVSLHLIETNKNNGLKCSGGNNSHHDCSTDYDSDLESNLPVNADGNEDSINKDIPSSITKITNYIVHSPILSLYKPLITQDKPFPGPSLKRKMDVISDGDTNSTILKKAYRERAGICNTSDCKVLSYDENCECGNVNIPIISDCKNLDVDSNVEIDNCQDDLTKLTYVKKRKENLDMTNKEDTHFQDNAKQSVTNEFSESNSRDNLHIERDIKNYQNEEISYSNANYVAMNQDKLHTNHDQTTKIVQTHKVKSLNVLSCDVINTIDLKNIAYGCNKYLASDHCNKSSIHQDISSTRSLVKGDNIFNEIEKSNECNNFTVNKVVSATEESLKKTNLYANDKTKILSDDTYIVQTKVQEKLQEIVELNKNDNGKYNQSTIDVDDKEILKLSDVDKSFDTHDTAKLDTLHHLTNNNGLEKIINNSDTASEKKNTLIDIPESELVLMGSPYKDPKIDTCYLCPIKNYFNEDVDKSVSKPVNPKEEEDTAVNHIAISNGILLYDDIHEDQLRVVLPKTTYSKQNLASNNRSQQHKNLKRKGDLLDRNNEKRYRKGKNIDYPKLKICAMNETAYIKEYNTLNDYWKNIKFSFSRPFHIDNLDVHNLLKSWPIQSKIQDITNVCENDNVTLLFDDNEIKSQYDPLQNTLAEEIAPNSEENEYKSVEIKEIDEINFSMGFGEGSDRVIQNYVDRNTLTKISAATLSDVKHAQPYLPFECYENNKNKLVEDKTEASQRYISFIRLKNKVRSYFKRTTLELNSDWMVNNVKEYKNHNLCDDGEYPFNVDCMDFFGLSHFDPVVQVVQVGQLPVSAAAQNPVTCDPRVTQVTDASPPQCSAENSPCDGSQASMKTEYTELTTADLSIPLVSAYERHQTMNSLSQDNHKLSFSDENIPIETEVNSVVKIEIAEEVLENEEQNDSDNHELHAEVANHAENTEYSFETNAAIESQDALSFESINTCSSFPQNDDQIVTPEKTDQIAHAMNAAGINTDADSCTAEDSTLGIIQCDKTSEEASSISQISRDNYAKTSAINAIALQQALAQILPPPLNRTNSFDNNEISNPPAHQVLHIVQGENSAVNQVTLVDNTQKSAINASNPTPVLHIVQNKGSSNLTSSAPSTHQQISFNGLSLVDGSNIQAGGNQLLHIVNASNQKSNTGQLLKRVNLLTNLSNVQGNSEQKMVQFVCKSADGKSIQLNAPHQRSMVLRLQPIESTNVHTANTENQHDLNSNSNITNVVSTHEIISAQQEIKSRSVYEENYAKFIQNSGKPPVIAKSTSLPKFNQAFGKQVFQDESQKESDINESNSHLSTINTTNETSEVCQSNNSLNMDQINQINSPPLLLQKSPALLNPQSQPSQPNLVQQIKQTITPMNIQTMHGGVIYTRQIPVNIGGGQTINLITVPSTELVEDSSQKQHVNQTDIEPSIIKIVPQTHNCNNAEVSSEDNSNNHGGNDCNQNNQPPPVLTQMRIKLPMLSKPSQIVSGTRVVRPSFFQIQRNVIGGVNQPVYQQLVLTAAPPLGQQTIRLPQSQANRLIKVPNETNQTSPESQMSSSTLEQLREFDMVLEQVKERSTVQPNQQIPTPNTTFNKIHTSPTETQEAPSSITTTESSQQVLYTIGNNPSLNVAYLNRKTTVTTTPTPNTFVRSPDSSNVNDSSSSSTQNQVSHSVTSEAQTNEISSVQNPLKSSKISSKTKSRPKSSSHPSSSVKVNTVAPKPSTQKPFEDEQTTQRILYILAEYKEQVENSPDKDKPAPRRRSNPPSNPGSSKRKKSSSSSRRSGTRDISPVHGDDTCRTMGSEDSSCGTSQGDCTENCLDSHSPQDSPRKVVRKLTFDNEIPTVLPRPLQPQRNVIVADGQTITVARSNTGKPTTAVLMPANYILPVSMVKSGQQIAIVTNRGPKILTVGGGEGGGNAVLLQRLIGPGLKPVLTRPGVRHVRLPAAALHNLQAFTLGQVTTSQQPDSTMPPSMTNPPALVETRATASPWAERGQDPKAVKHTSPVSTEPWNLPSATLSQEYSYEEIVRADNMDRTVLDAIPDRYSPDIEAQRIFDKMFDIDSKKSYVVDSQDDSPRCGFDIDASDCDDKAYPQVVHRKDGTTQRHHRLTHVSAAALRHRYAILEHELKLQKSLSEECEDLGVDSPSAAELFPEAELLFSSSPAHDAPHHSHTPQPSLNQGAVQPDIDDQIATDQLIGNNEPDEEDLNMALGLDNIVTVSGDGMQATITLDPQEFARSHPNTTFHKEPTDESELQPFTIANVNVRHMTSTIFHASRAPATVLVTAPQTTVISQATPDGGVHNMKFPETPSIPQQILPTVLVKDNGVSKFDSMLNDRELHLSNTASTIIHSSSNTTQVIRRVGCDDDKNDPRFLDTNLMDDAKVAEDSRDATLESIADADDDRSSPERNAEMFWESNSTSERSESRRPLDFSSDSEKCCKSPFEENNSTDSSGLGTHIMRLDSVIKEARGVERSGSADGSSADDAQPPLRTYPPKRTLHGTEVEMERSTSGKTRAGERSQESMESRRRASNRGVVKRGCHCCNGSPAPKPKKSRPRKPPPETTD